MWVNLSIILKIHFGGVWVTHVTPFFSWSRVFYIYIILIYLLFIICLEQILWNGDGMLCHSSVSGRKSLTFLSSIYLLSLFRISFLKFLALLCKRWLKVVIAQIESNDTEGWFFGIELLLCSRLHFQKENGLSPPKQRRKKYISNMTLNALYRFSPFTSHMSRCNFFCAVMYRFLFEMQSTT